MQPRIAICVTLSISAALFGCGRNDREHGTAAPAATTTTTARIAVTDQELASFLAWMREDAAMSDRHRAETQRISQEAFDRADSGQDVARDPEYVAMLDRQRRETQALKNAMPVSEEKARALGQTIAGIGNFMLQHEKTEPYLAFVPGRNDHALEDARAKYGDEFVLWVLSREKTIVETLTR